MDIRRGFPCLARLRLGIERWPSNSTGRRHHREIVAQAQTNKVQVESSAMLFHNQSFETGVLSSQGQLAPPHRETHEATGTWRSPLIGAPIRRRAGFLLEVVQSSSKSESSKVVQRCRRACITFIGGGAGFRALPRSAAHTLTLIGAAATWMIFTSAPCPLACSPVYANDKLPRPAPSAAPGRPRSNAGDGTHIAYISLLHPEVF